MPTSFIRHSPAVVSEAAVQEEPPFRGKTSSGTESTLEPYEIFVEATIVDISDNEQTFQAQFGFLVQGSQCRVDTIS